jgi:hypothetical protein
LVGLGEDYNSRLKYCEKEREDLKGAELTMEIPESTQL